MESNNFFYGNIRRVLYVPCGGKLIKRDFLYKKDALLLRFRDNYFIDISNLYSISDFCNIVFSCDFDGILSFKPLRHNCFYVDKNSLRPYYIMSKDSNINVK